MDRREAGEELYRRKFDELGISESFEFLSRDWNSIHGERVIAKCKQCGNIFATWALKDIASGKQKHLLCPYCGAASDGEDMVSRSPKGDAAMAYYASGHSVKETAELFGFTKDQINYFVKSHRVSNGRDWREAAQKSNRERSEKARINREKEKTEQAKWRAEQTKERQRLEEIEKDKKRQERELKIQRAEAEKADALFHLLNDKVHVCTVCGKAFSKAEYMKDSGLKQVQHDPQYCSYACKRKAYNKKSKECKKRSGNFDRGNHRRRAREFGVAYESGITLKKVEEKDGGVCQVCGKPCDRGDHSWSDYCGPMYPSIDHIIPMAKGGSHTWGNVQLAHMICNSEKGDKEAIRGEKNI